jgi:gluconolactonase
MGYLKKESLQQPVSITMKLGVKLKINLGVIFGIFIAGNLWSQSPHTLPSNLAAPGTPTLTLRETSGTVFAEGVAADWNGNVFFNEMDNNNRTMRLPVAGGEAKIWRQAKDTPNGMWMDPEGRLVICQSKAIVRVSTIHPFDGETDTLYRATGTTGEFNDVTGDSQGNLFFTNFNGGSVFFRSVAGQTRNVLSGKPKPNGVEWDEERKLVYVAENQAGWVRSYTVTADFNLENGKDFAQVAGGDGITLDENGNVYVVSFGQSVFVFNPEGQPIGTIPFGTDNHQLTNLAFGGANFKTLYMINNKGLYALPMQVKGYKSGNYAVALRPRLRLTQKSQKWLGIGWLRLDGKRFQNRLQPPIPSAD